MQSGHLRERPMNATGHHTARPHMSNVHSLQWKRASVRPVAPHMSQRYEA